MRPSETTIHRFWQKTIKIKAKTEADVVKELELKAKRRGSGLHDWDILEFKDGKARVGVKYGLIGHERRIIPAEIVRQKTRYNFKLAEIAKYWDIPSSVVRKILLERGIEIPRANRG